MKYEKHQKALRLRRDGFSVKEITKKLEVSQSTTSLWVRNVVLSDKARLRLRGRITAGQLASGEAKKRRTDALNKELRSRAQVFVQSSRVSPGAEQILCAFLYWCEGAKSSRNGVSFTNSDPQLARLFVDLMVSRFGAARSRFVCRLHLHEYHRERIQTLYWSTALNIPLMQFRKTYWKPHTGKRIRDAYPGCISVRYYDSILARNIMYVAKAYMEKHMGA